MSYRNFKRAIDVLGAALGLTVTAPVLVVVSVAIRHGDGGPVLFRQERVGRNGHYFTILKFRSMSVGAPNTTSVEKERLASHITPVGRIIRRTNIDELPQLFNVLRGDMSLIGPRPALAEQAALLNKRSNSCKELRPGLTGLAQIRSYEGMSISEKARWDNEYAEDVGPLRDFQIGTATFAYLLKPPPTY